MIEKFKINHSILKEFLPSGVWEKRVEKTKHTIKLLLSRYDISHKNILTVGGGSCFEEYNMMSMGDNKITCIDNDAECGALEILKKIIMKVKISITLLVMLAPL